MLLNCSFSPMRFNTRPRLCAGFTLLELVLTLVLVGLLAVAANGLFADKKQFDNRVVADRLLVELQKVQQVAMSRDNGRSLRLQVRRSGTQTVLQLRQQSFLYESQFESLGAMIRWLEPGVGGCRGGMRNLPLQLDYLPDGRVVTPAGASTSAILCVDDTRPVCISAEGHAYADACP